MTPQDIGMLDSLMIPPLGRGDAAAEDVLRYFSERHGTRYAGADGGRALGLRLVGDAVESQNADDLGAALLVPTTFGYTADYLDLLVRLTTADWHGAHEDVVLALGRLRDPASVDALYHAGWWVPEYLDWDENRALALKAVRALGRIPGPAAEQALEKLLSTGSEIVREMAQVQLERRHQ